MPVRSLPRILRLVGPQDLVWLLVFGALVFTLPVGDAPEVLPLVCLGIVQILEPKIPALHTTRGRIFWITLKLVLGFVFIGYTGSINSPYWLVLLLPVLSAATAFGVAGSLVFTLLPAASYLAFLFWVRETSQVTADLVVRIAFLVMLGNLANILAQELRVQLARQRRTAEQLADANRQLQEAEEAARRSDRLAALGQLSAGLAHELRNPLGTIRASSEMLNRSLSGENQVAREVAGFIGSEVDRANSLITRFLDFARPLRPRLDSADLAPTLDRAISMVERERPGVAIYKNYEPAIPAFPFDAELLERVFYNLVLNAAQATPEGGAVTVKTRASEETAEIAVIDRGVGIETAQRDSIFNPFFTTKPDGVGLGLAIVAKIVDEHGGKIMVESEPGKGSIFRVLLPLQPAPQSVP